jgi:hypothetical protein
MIKTPQVMLQGAVDDRDKKAEKSDELFKQNDLTLCIKK